ncbi:lactonase family protein [Tamlana fucoidanivorans]|uniref:Lactonase family protein n=1 Tax=Allotamlana fucoidanivorans TaxID=2583814 RepID=A0A5C4SMI6_9FLAO|nr:lactonase family protein [Tamlana fucoidanivorans]TNJ45289.1 lactonase family protein [Tamlana fucoidanivorans]
MTTKLVHSFILSFVFLTSNSQDIPLYIGTYTSGNSEGIYKMTFNTKTGVLHDLQLAVKAENPSFLAFSPKKNYLYAVGEGQTSAVMAFKMKPDGYLQHINTENSEGKGPCHISINQEGNLAVVSNYGGGTVSFLPINTNGALSEASQVFNHNTETEKAHAHSAKFFKNDIYVADLGRNALYQYQLKDTKYQLKSDSLIETTGNPGPRHFEITKDGQFIYIINEYGGSITSIKKIGNGFKMIDYDSTLDPDFKGKNKCADIHLSHDERFLYGSNRGENTIAVFKRDTKTGEIDKIQSISVHGDWPRNFTLDPTGNFLLVANKLSENIAVYSIDKNSGQLTFLHDVKVPTPVCLLF